MDTTRGAGDRAKDAATTAADHPWLETAARVGFAASGLIHLLIAWIAVQVAWGGGSDEGSGGSQGKADQSGALSTLAENPLGVALLVVIVAGFLGLALWQAGEAAVGSTETADRIKAAAKAVVYLALAWSALSFVLGRGKSSSGQTQDATATLLDAPFGRVLVTAVGIGVLGVGAYHVYKGWTRGFLDDLEGSPSAWTTRSGQVGYVAKGVALLVVGALFGLAGIRGSSQEATGLDGALKTLRDAAFGPWLLSAVALGLAAYGLYSFSRAKHAKL